ncbi:MAG: PxxKW family cysteine-rich protein [Deltaproteobacteria bacterium]|nr:PxxKW family cysteine-rich protein [Deltaproteobacteria bacterium]MCF8120129.1 PxxKW family cysteine-rich protein [Deltaproteobacteria bacterium]
MVCQTVKHGHDCFFMTKKGCSFNGGTCHIIVEACEGCQKVIALPTGKYCQAFPDPAAKWRVGNCNMATHLQATAGKENGKINPLKASKRRGH